MTPRTSSTARFWGEDSTSERLAWDWVEQQLEVSEAYWVVTSGVSGDPLSRPVWGVWMEGRLFLTVGSTSLGSNLARNPRVEVHLASPHDVIVVSGTAGPERDAGMLQRMCEVYNPKYSWDLVPKSAGPVFAVSPHTVIAWRTVPASESSPGMEFPEQAGKWTF